MQATGELPIAAAKAVLVAFLRDGCEASEVAPPFPNEEGALPFAFIQEDEWDEVEEPCFVVYLGGPPSPVGDTSTRWWWVPLEVRFYAPPSADEELLQTVQTKLADLINGCWHEREGSREAENPTPLAARLTAVAQEMNPPQRFGCAFHRDFVTERLEADENTVQIIAKVEVCCGLLEP